MMGFVRIGVFGFLALSVLYILLAIYSRSVRREELEKEWDEEIKTGDRDAYIEEGLREYQHSLRRKLIWLVYIIPVVVISGLIYVINFM